MERFKFANGVAGVHGADKCSGDHCCIHRPSLHSMVEEPMVLHEGGLVDRLCAHGTAHPDPDSVAHFERRGIVGMGEHGCDGCCSKLTG